MDASRGEMKIHEILEKSGLTIYGKNVTRIKE